MNYRHAFHAGSFADVFKHAVLCRILHYLRAKPAPYR
ncbi:MAG TPA: 23S rRNA (adenine(2030)-N(6))-methyltransferase RlmJ, partial [Pseudolabrys sp.]